MKHKFLIIIASLALIISLSGCVKQIADNAQYGTLKGVVSIGPICPVEKPGNESACRPTQAVFDAWPIGIYSDDSKFAQIQLDQNGAYEINLPEGDYAVRLIKGQPFGVGSSNLPADIAVKAGEAINLDINIDTGIR